MTPRERLADLMEARASELGMRWEDVAAAGGPAVRTLQAIRHEDKPLRRLTVLRIETALRWERGSVSLILDGGDPAPLPDGPSAADDERRRQYPVFASLDDDLIVPFLEVLRAERRAGVPLRGEHEERIMASRRLSEAMRLQMIAEIRWIDAGRPGLSEETAG